MAMTSFDRIFNVESCEYGYTVEDCYPVEYGGYIKLYIPKLMGVLSFSGLDYLKYNQIFKNNSNCKPLVDKNVRLTDYLNVPVRSSGGWESKINDNGIIPKNTEFIVEFINGNIQRPFTTTK